MNNSIKAIILAGGFGTRMWNLTNEGDRIPKPLLKLGDKTILERIIDNYIDSGIYHFIICGGYQFQKIYNYFEILKENGKYSNCIIKVIDTGLNTMTGGRVKKISHFLKEDEYFLLSYGDAISDVCISKSIETFIKNKSMITMTIKEYENRFGEVIINKDDNTIIGFHEKRKSWINIGYFVLSSKILDMIDGDSTSFEIDVIEKQILTIGQKNVTYCIHEGKWECMDTEEEYFKQKKLFS